MTTQHQALDVDRLRQAAQTILDQWNSPKWEWHKLGPTADLMAELRAAIAAVPTAAQSIASGVWDGAEEWMTLAWALCADECGEEACAELVWDNSPIPEPWEGRWLKYEGQAKEMIAMVRKHVAAAQPQQPVRELMSDEQIDLLQEYYDCFGNCDAPRIHELARAIEHNCAERWGVTLAGITKEGK